MEHSRDASSPSTTSCSAFSDFESYTEPSQGEVAQQMLRRTYAAAAISSALSDSESYDEESEGSESEDIWEKLRCTYADYRKAHPAGDLCQRCAGINWSHLLFDSALQFCERYAPLELFPVSETSWELSASSCSLCRLLGSAKEFQEGSGQVLVVCCTCKAETAVSHMSHIFDYEQGRDDVPQHSPFLRLRTDTSLGEALDIGGFAIQDLHNTAENSLVRKLNVGSIDYSILQGWLDYCKCHHATNCNRPYKPPIPGLKVIDCNTKQIVAAPWVTPFHFVALSYVWGSPETSGNHQPGFPETICDAITVTVELGYKYLWVDQFCIDQLDASHKQAQIQLMGRIYAESQLVIVAAAGDSSNHGLPGVGRKPRKAQKSLQIDTGVELIERFVPREAINGSTWASRGWTHQEGYLAPRRMIFTEHQVLYVCGRALWQESVQQSTLGYEGLYLRVRQPHFRRSLYSSDNVFDVLSNYSTRKLSFESDIVNACVGLLNKFVDYHYWGMPVQYEGFRWSYEPKSRPVLLLSWHSRCPGQRREGFPSWSWVATTGPKSIRHPRSSDLGYVAHIRAVDGSWRSLDEQYESRYDILPAGYGPTLRLTGRFYTASLVMNHKPSGPNIHETQSEGTPLVVLQHADTDGDDIQIAFQLWLDANLTNSDLRNAIKAVPAIGHFGAHWDTIKRSYEFANDGKWYYDRPPIFMIFQTVGDHYKRIGLTHDSCCILETKTGLMRRDPDGVAVPHPTCRGDEEVIYIE